MMTLPRSLQGRLMVLLLALMSAVWLAVAALTWRDVRHELDELLDSHLAQAAALLVVQQARELGESDDGADDDAPAPDAPLLHRYAPKVAFQVFHEGKLVLRSANAPATPMARAGFRSGFDSVQIDGAAWRVFAAHGAKRDVQVYVGEQAASRAAILWAVLRSMLWPMLLALPLLALGAWWAVRVGVAPMRRLGRLLAARRPDALQPVELIGATSEMAPMVAALNDLFGRIGKLLEAERRFTADAAHELRTPIAAIRIQAQVALAETDDARRRHALQATLDGCDRATRLAEQLLTLSRLEAEAALGMAAVDLGALTRRVLAELAPKALANGQTLELEAAEGCLIEGDETLLAVLVRNLADNALRYSPPGARVLVDLRRVAGADNNIVLRIEDSGPGLLDAERARLGERFFRVTGSNASGSGLGWSIVRRIAAVHQLEVQVERSAQLGGLAVQVSARAIEKE
jgi:two-component system, OmpR family, sensor histidine kinase QseC